MVSLSLYYLPLKVKFRGEFTNPAGCFVPQEAESQTATL